jgi:hypothetical protein
MNTMKQPIVKKVQSREELFIQFTDEELAELNIKKNQKFTCDVFDDGSIKLTPFATLELDIDELSKEDLVFLIQRSCDEDISVNEVICSSLRELVKDYNV